MATPCGDPGGQVRTVNLRRLRNELDLIMEIYNETWSGKWGYVPISAAELDKMAADMSLILDPDIAFIAEVDGKAAGMCIMVPNLNEVIADLGGKLFPFGWAKLLWRAKVKHSSSARLILLGVRESIRRNVKRYGFLSTAMYVEVAKRGLAKGYDWAELSWTREDDAPINLGIRAMGADGVQDVPRVRETARLTSAVPVSSNTTTRDEHARTKSAVGISLLTTSIPRNPATEDERAGISGGRREEPLVDPFEGGAFGGQEVGADAARDDVELAYHRGVIDRLKPGGPKPVEVRREVGVSGFRRRYRQALRLVATVAVALEELGRAEVACW